MKDQTAETVSYIWFQYFSFTLVSLNLADNITNRQYTVHYHQNLVGEGRTKQHITNCKHAQIVNMLKGTKLSNSLFFYSQEFNWDIILGNPNSLKPTSIFLLLIVNFNWKTENDCVDN